MIEHWDIIEEMVEGDRQISGPTEPTDLDGTDENKALVRQLLADDGIGEVPIEHGRAGPAVYEEIHNVVGCGDLIGPGQGRQVLAPDSRPAPAVR